MKNQYTFYMADPIKRRYNRKPDRNEELWEVYGKVIEGHGADAPYISKQRLYEETAIKVHLVSGTVRNLLRELFKERGDPRQKVCQNER